MASCKAGALVVNNTAMFLVAEVYWYKTSWAVQRTVTLRPHTRMLVTYSETDMCTTFRLVIHVSSDNSGKKKKVTSTAVNGPIRLTVNTLEGRVEVTEEKTTIEEDIMKHARLKALLTESPTHTFYEILQVKRDCAPEDIKAAFASRIDMYVCDLKSSNRKVAERAFDLFQDLNAAYLVLQDQQARANYDKRLKGQEALAAGVFSRRYWQEVWRSGRFKYLLGGFLLVGGGLAIAFTTAGLALPIVLGVGGVCGGAVFGGGVGTISYTLSKSATLDGVELKTLAKYVAIYGLFGAIAGLAGAGAGVGLHGVHFINAPSCQTAIEGTHGACWGLAGAASDGVASGSFSKMTASQVFCELAKGTLAGAGAGCVGGAILGAVNNALLVSASGELGVSQSSLRLAVSEALEQFPMLYRKGIVAGQTAACTLAKRAICSVIGYVAPTKEHKNQLMAMHGVSQHTTKDSQSHPEQVSKLDPEPCVLILKAQRNVRMIVKYRRLQAGKPAKLAYQEAPRVTEWSSDPKICLPPDTDFDFGVYVSFQHKAKDITAFNRSSDVKAFSSPKKPHRLRLTDPTSKAFHVYVPYMGKARIECITIASGKDAGKLVSFSRSNETVEWPQQLKDLKSLTSLNS